MMIIEETYESIIEIFSQEIFWEQLFDDEADVLNKKGYITPSRVSVDYYENGYRIVAERLPRDYRNESIL